MPHDVTDCDDWRAIVRRIAADPAPDLPRLVAADWLEDQGEGERAEFIRVQCEVARLTGFIHRSLYRLSEALEASFQKINEPLADVLDYFQGFAVQLGFLEEGTNKWGDAVRNASDVGRAAVGKLAFAFGAFEGAMKIVGGFAYEYIASPYFKVVAAVYEAIGKMVQNISKILEENIPKSIKDNLPAGTFKGLDGVGKAIADASALSKKLNDDLLKSAKEAQNTDWLARANKREQQVIGKGGAIDEQEEKVAQQRREWFDQMARNIDYANAKEAGTAPEPVAPKAIEKITVETSSELGKAILAGSQEAANLIARASTGGPAPSLEKIAAFAATQNARQLEANSYLKRMVQLLEDRKDFGLL